MELVLWLMFVLVIGAFICEYVDSTLGMGYGTTLTPVLLLVGFAPMQIVPAILLSEFMQIQIIQTGISENTVFWT